MITSFAVKSRYASVYMAFIEECEKIGWEWNELFSPKSNVNNYTTHNNSELDHCIYFADNWGVCFGKQREKPLMSFSSSYDRFDLDTNFHGEQREKPLMSFSSSNDRYDLDTNFHFAVELAREVFNHLRKRNPPILMESLTDSYGALINHEGIRVGRQNVTFEKFDKLVKLVEEYRK